MTAATRTLRTVIVAALVGAAVFPADGTTPESLLAVADLAALEAKRRSRSTRPRRQAA